MGGFPGRFPCYVEGSTKACGPKFVGDDERWLWSDLHPIPSTYPSPFLPYLICRVLGGALLLLSALQVKFPHSVIWFVLIPSLWPISTVVFLLLRASLTATCDWLLNTPDITEVINKKEGRFLFFLLLVFPRPLLRLSYLS